MGNNMKKHKLIIREKDKAIFEAIKSGRKKVETRAAIDDYKKIKQGDIIVFVCGQRKAERKVKNTSLYKSIGALFRRYKVSDIFPDLTKINEARKIYYSFPGYREKIKKFGLIVFELK
jgi:ASC-1-like (ASCH) protein